MDAKAGTATPETSILMEDKAADRPVGRSAFFCKRILKENLVILLTMIGVGVGFAIGVGVRELKPSEDTLMWLGMPGELFLRVLNLMIGPLIVGSIISGTSSLAPKSNGKISAVAFTWIMCTNILGCLFGVLLCLTIRPGEGEGGVDDSKVTSPFETQDIFADLLRNLFPNNIVEVGFRKALTQYNIDSKEVMFNLTNGTMVSVTVDTQTKSNGKSDSVNILGLVFIGVIFGMAANSMGKRADIFVKFFSVLTELSLNIVKWFFWSSPVGVASLIARVVASIPDLHASLAKLGQFVMVVLVGILVFQTVVLSSLLLLFTRRNPLYFHWSILRSYLVGCAGPSAVIALPEMIHCCEVTHKMDPRVVRFCVPFSVTTGKCGSALFIAASAIFIAQYIDRDLSASDVAMIAVLGSVSPMALPSVPSGSLVTLVIVLAALNIPSSNIALLFAVEWLLDRIRTGCNIICHCCCAAVTYRFCKAGLASQDLQLVSRDTELAIPDTELVSRDHDLVSRDTELAIPDTELVSRDHHLVSRDTEVVSRDTDLVNQNKRLMTQDTDLVSPGTKVASGDPELVKRDTEEVMMKTGQKEYENNMESSSSNVVISIKT